LQTPVSTIKKKGTVLYNKLFTNDFETIRPTVIIADDILHYLPFELLVKDNAYLLENHTISYASSFYFLNSKGKEGNVSRNKKAVFFAPEYSGTVQENQLALRDAAYTLSGAKEEVKQLSKLIAGRKYIGNQASKRNFKSLDPDISILHLAMHSNLNDGDPELSNLMFSNTEEDYEMYISELYGMNFNADLAVLSACNTGIGGFKDGGNLVSIHQAFTIAGIPATIASLWHAPDHSTKEIMLLLYGKQSWIIYNRQQMKTYNIHFTGQDLYYRGTIPQWNCQHHLCGGNPEVLAVYC
jgi:CHAT domain-containing protein